MTSKTILNTAKNTARCITLLLILLSCLTVKAENALSEPDDSQKKIYFLQNSLRDESFHAGVWWYGWMGFCGIMGTASFTYASLSHDRTIKITQTISGIESTLGLAGLILSPLPAAYASRTLQSMPQSSSAQRINKLEKAEAWLYTSAENESLGRSWINHALTFAVTAGGGVIIWKGYGNQIRKNGDNPLKEGLISFFTGFAVGELQILTQPTASIRNREIYRSRFGNESKAETNIRVVFIPSGRDFYAAAVYEF